MTTDLSWAASAVESAAPFNRLLGVRCERLTEDGSEIVLPDAEQLHNHVGGPHAGALFGLGETAAAAVVLAVFADLLGEYVPLVRGAEIDYRTLARGDVSARARFAGDAQEVRATLAARGRATFPVEVVFSAGGQQTGTMTARMALRRQDDGLSPRPEG